MKKLYKLEALRGFVAVYVMIGHTFGHNQVRTAPTILSPFLRFGQEAVIIFFILSGFVIQYSYQYSKDKTFKTYFLKRFLRIYIPLIIVFIMNFLILHFENNNFSSGDIETLLGNLFMLQDISFIKTNVICPPFLGNLPLWSLSYEWWFYMMFFVLSHFSNKGNSNYIYFVSILSGISYIFFPNFINRIGLYIIIWWLGADLAKLYIDKKDISIQNLKKPLLSLILCIFILIANLLVNYEKIKLELGTRGTPGESPILELRHFIFALIAIIVAIIWKKYKWIFFSKTIGLFAPIASISFGIYISHWFLLSHAHYLDSTIDNIYLRDIIYLITCLLFSYIVERKIYVDVSRYILDLFKNSKPTTLPITNTSTTL